MKFYSLTGLSLILVSALSVLAQSQLAAFSSPKPSPQSQVTTTSPKPATSVPSSQSKTPPAKKATPPQTSPAKATPTSIPQTQPANHSSKATPPQTSPAKATPTSIPQSQPSSKLATSPQTGNPSPQTPTKGTGFQPLTPFLRPEATYIGSGKKQTHVENRSQQRDAGLSTGVNGTATIGANGVFVNGSASGTASQDRNNSTQECRSVGVKVSTTPAVYRAPDGHIFQMQQPVKEEVLNNNPWTACPKK